MLCMNIIQIPYKFIIAYWFRRVNIASDGLTQRYNQNVFFVC